MNVLMDSSFVIDLLNEVAEGVPGCAMRWLEKIPGPGFGLPR
jgi:hypothetical protein